MDLSLLTGTTENQGLAPKTGAPDVKSGDLGVTPKQGLTSETLFSQYLKPSDQAVPDVLLKDTKTLLQDPSSLIRRASRQEALQVLSNILGKGKSVIEKSDALSLLFEPEVGVSNFAGMVAVNPFISEALSTGVSEFMSQEASAAEILLNCR